MNIEHLKEYVSSNSIEWRKHVFERMLERDISRSDVKEVLLNGELISNYPKDKPFPSALFFKVVNSRPLHVVAAIDLNKGKVFIITVYEPSLEIFKKDFKTRRKS